MNAIKGKRGFTLIELMIVVAIIGILAAIAIPKFSQLITKGNEASTKGNLGALRSALSIYYGDTEGSYPQAANAATTAIGSLTAGGKYLSIIPNANVPGNSVYSSPSHGNINSEVDSVAATNGPTPTDVGGWVYDSGSGDTNWGKVVVNCTHNDSRGNVWSTY